MAQPIKEFNPGRAPESELSQTELNERLVVLKQEQNKNKNKLLHIFLDKVKPLLSSDPNKGVPLDLKVEKGALKVSPPDRPDLEVTLIEDLSKAPSKTIQLVYVLFSQTTKVSKLEEALKKKQEPCESTPLLTWSRV